MSRTALSFWLIVVTALFLRVITINQQGFWYDELLTVKISPLSWHPLLAALDHTDNAKPPLYYLFMHEWLKGGHSETWVRLPAALFGALTCGVYFLLSLRLLGNVAAWLATAYLVLSPFHLNYSQDARMYGLFVLETALALLFLLRFLDHQNIRDLLAFGLFNVLLEYTFSYGFFFFGLAALLLLVRWKEIGSRNALGLSVALVVALGLFAPWLAHMVDLSGTSAGEQLYKGPPWAAVGYTFYALGYGFDLGPSITDLQASGSGYFRVHPGQTLLVFSTLLVLLVLLAQGVWALRRNRLALAYTLGGLFIFLLCPAIISLIKPSITYNPRYAILALLPFGVLMAAGLEASWKRGGGMRLPVIVFVVGLTWALGNFYFNPAYRREDLRGAARYVETLQPAPQALVLSPGYLATVFDYYYHGSTPVLAFTTSGPDFDAETQKLTEDLHGSGHFAVIYVRPDYGDPRGQLFPWLESHYSLLEEAPITGGKTALFKASSPALHP